MFQFLQIFGELRIAQLPQNFEIEQAIAERCFWVDLQVPRERSQAVTIFLPGHAIENQSPRGGRALFWIGPQMLEHFQG